MPEAKEGEDGGGGGGGGRHRHGHSAARHHAGIHMEKSRVAIFASGPPHYDTIISIHGAWRPVRNRCSSHRRQQGEDGGSADGGGGGIGGRNSASASSGGGGGGGKKGTSELFAPNEGTHDVFLTPSVVPRGRMGSLSSRHDSEDIMCVRVCGYGDEKRRQ